MTDELDDLKRDYRRIHAPPYVATCIRAELADKPFRMHSRIRVAAALVTAVAVVGIVPYVLLQQSAKPLIPGKPSLSALASLKPDKPAGPAPSLSQLRSVKVPKLPAKPHLSPEKPQTNYQFDYEFMEEKDHAYI